jgi:hypothetical protein
MLSSHGWRPPLRKRRRRQEAAPTAARFDEPEPAATSSTATAKQRLRFDQVIADGEAHQLAEAGEIHFFHYVIAVAFYGAGGDAY